MIIKQLFLSLTLFGGLNLTAIISFNSPEEILNQGIEFIECAFCDINGKLRSVTIPAQELLSAAKDGLKFDSSSVPGCANVNNSDMHLKLDLNACIILPPAMRHYKTIMIMCDICISESENYEGCTRNLLKKQRERLANIDLQLNVGTELEFYILDSNNQTIDSDRYFDISIDIETENSKQLLLDTLIKAGIDAEKIHHEVGPGQYEVSFKYKDCVTTADNTLFAKYIISSIVKKLGARATFMPKPIVNQNGNGMHVHYSLFDTINQHNVFYNEESNTKLSDLAQFFLAGNLKHMLEISALLNPTINSYKRLVPCYEAPVYICWGIKNRSALIRIPLINALQKEAVRAELRCPDASCNPYLTLAAIAASGIKGMQEQIGISNPVTGNLYKLNEDQIKRMGIQTLHRSLEKALISLNNSIFAEEFLGKKLLHEFARIKKAELKSFDNRNHSSDENLITEWEITRYL